MIDKLNEILKGIDQDCCYEKDGWWETSCGAEFGAKKLKEVQDLVKKLTLTNVSQQREMFYNFITWYNAKPKVEKNKDGLVTTGLIDEFLKL